MHGRRTTVGGFAVAVTFASVALVPVAGQTPASAPARVGASVNSVVRGGYSAPRAVEGYPDVSGLWNAATLTPLERPSGNATMTEAEAQKIEKDNAANRQRRSQNSDPNRDAPPVGGDGSTGASGNVGGYNNFWVDPGDSVVVINGERRTSIIIEPANGRIPRGGRGLGRGQAPAAPATAQAPTSDAPENFVSQARGAYDNPEIRPLAERCIIGFGSTAGPPALPVLYNNFKQIVQTPGYVMILNEMNHDVRVVRMNTKQHAPTTVRKWLGDSIGWYEGDTLVVETTNFTEKTRFSGSTSNLKVTERFRRLASDVLLYRFTVDDPAVFSAPWTGEYIWKAGEPDDHLYEYACHEGNHAFGDIMRGARLLEKEAEEAAKQR